MGFFPGINPVVLQVPILLGGGSLFFIFNIKVLFLYAVERKVDRREKNPLWSGVETCVILTLNLQS